MTKSIRVPFVVFLFLLLFIYAGVNGYFFASKNLASGFPGWFVRRDGRVLLARFSSDHNATPLAEGDEIIALNDRPFRERSQYFETFAARPAGSAYTITVRREGRPQTFWLQTTALPRSLLVAKLLTEGRIITFIWLLMGLTIFLLRPDNKQAVLLALMIGLLAIGGDASPNLILAQLPFWLLAALIPVYVISVLSLPVILHFFLIFPEPSTIVRRFPATEYLLYLPWLLLVAPIMIMRAFVWITAPAHFWETYQHFAWLIVPGNFLLMLYNLLALAVLALNYRQSSELARRKIRVVVIGSFLSFLPFLVMKLISFYRGEFAIDDLTAVMATVVILLISLFPLSFAYAIARHQVIPISLIVRRSVQYLMAKNALRLLLALPIVGLALTVFANPHRTLDEILLHNSIYFYALVAVALGLGLVYRNRVTDWIDRKFFRESYNQENILRELIDDVKRLDSISEMSRRVSHQVERALHPEHVYLFYREEERRDLSLGYSTGGAQSELRLPEEFQLLRFVEQHSGALDFPFPSNTDLPQTEIDWLARLGTRLAVPITGTDRRLTGLFLLGEKKSQVPYTGTDRGLLEVLANQIAIVYENARLKERIDKDRRVKHEVLARVQERDINLLKECPRCGTCFDTGATVCATDGDELTLTLPIERTIEKRYRLDRLIGHGGMGAVYQAVDLRLHRAVAVKILSGRLFGDSNALRRFEREAHTSARLNHQHIITVYDYGVLNTEGAYLVMELVRGETLGKILKREKRLTPARAAEWFDEVLTAVAFAHSAGIIHRDLKPENIFVAAVDGGRKTVKVLDFGLAKIVQADLDSAVSAATAPVTSPGTVLGTFGYMSPEQLMGQQVDERSDLFSIGVMIVEVLTGRRPFAGKTYHELLTNILQKPFRLRGDGPEISAFNQVLKKCLAANPAERFSSAAEMRQHLVPAIRNCPDVAFHTLAEPEAQTAILNR